MSHYKFLKVHFLLWIDNDLYCCWINFSSFYNFPQNSCSLIFLVSLCCKKDRRERTSYRTWETGKETGRAERHAEVPSSHGFLSKTVRRAHFCMQQRLKFVRGGPTSENSDEFFFLHALASARRMCTGEVLTHLSFVFAQETWVEQVGQWHRLGGFHLWICDQKVPLGTGKLCLVKVWTMTPWRSSCLHWSDTIGYNQKNRAVNFEEFAKLIKARDLGQGYWTLYERRVLTIWVEIAQQLRLKWWVWVFCTKFNNYFYGTDGVFCLDFL